MDLISLRDPSIKKVRLYLGKNKGYQIYGSNCIGELGTLLFCSDQRKCSIPLTYQYVSVTTKSHVSIKSLCIKREYCHAFCFFYTNTKQDIPTGSAVSFDQKGISNRVSQKDPVTFMIEVKGVYQCNGNSGLIWTQNGVPILGSNDTFMTSFNEGDLIQVINPGPELSITNASFNLFRIY